MKNVLKRHRSKIMIILLSSILLGCSQEKMILKKEKFVVEYGQSISTKVKYSLQGTTQGRYLTGGVPPVRFSM